jgi:alkanesulfonate monooxygenase SsuD/methylene tetrahydromethanopterin reductase-like flavin-dependent oxidoreductase (luciferase family)
MDTCYAYGQNPSQLRQRYEEAHDLVLKSWTEPEPFVWNGRFHKLRYVNPWPRPLQKPHPPVWIPGGGSVETWQWCARRDYVYSYLSYFGYKAGEATMRGFWREMERLGKDANPYRAGFLQFVGVAESRREALDLYREPAEYFYRRCLHVDPRFAVPPGYTTEKTLRARVQSMVAQAAERAGDRHFFQQPDFEAVVDRGYVIVGSPDEVAEQLRAVATELNVGHLMLLMQFGNMGRELAFHNTELFAKRVMPQLSGLFDDRWEDLWWPRPLPAERRAAVRDGPR